jgi:hypothetical protein
MASSDHACTWALAPGRPLVAVAVVDQVGRVEIVVVGVGNKVAVVWRPYHRVAVPLAWVVQLVMNAYRGQRACCVCHFVDNANPFLDALRLSYI